MDVGKVIRGVFTGEKRYNEDKTMSEELSRERNRELIMSLREKSKEIGDMPARAKEVLEFFNIDLNNLEDGVPIIRLLREMGFKVYQSQLEPRTLSAYIAVNPEYKQAYGSNKITCVQREDSPGHKRFALAHELAHYFFDFDDSKNVAYYNTYYTEQECADAPSERRANAFAANLLMPKDIFLRKTKEYSETQGKPDVVNSLADFFGVSPTAVFYRFKELQVEGYEN